MAQHKRELEQTKPKGNTPAKAAKRRESPGKTYRQKGFGPKDLPKGKIEQHPARPGRTTPQ